MPLIPYLLALAAGAALTVQIGANAAARRYLGGDAVAAALASFVIGAVALAVYGVAMRVPWTLRSALSAPAWVWSGGLLGGFYVVTSVLVGPRLGAAAFLALAVLGQLAASLVVDQFGWLGFAQHPITVARVVGALMLLGGVLLVTR